MGGWRDEPKILTRGDGGMEGIPPRPGTAMDILGGGNRWVFGGESVARTHV